MNQIMMAVFAYFKVELRSPESYTDNIVDIAAVKQVFGVE